MTKIISSKSAKVAAVAMGLIAGFAMVASTASAYTFSTNLKVGSKGADVKNLQMVLNMSADTQVASTGAGSPGMETSSFGPATKKAVIKFQNKYASDTLAPAGLTAGTGFVGALTRIKLGKMGSTTSTTPPTSTSTTTTTTTGPLSVSLANDNPSASAVVAGQATADLAHFTFTGNGTLTNVKLQRTGISSNTTLSNVYLFQGNARVSDGASVDTNGVITFNNLGLAVNGSLSLSVRADIAAGSAGQIIGVQLTGYSTTGSAGMVTANISGNYMNVASATLATVTLSGTQAAPGSPNAGTMAYTLWSQSASVTSRSVLLKGATFKYIGSATTDALANARLYVNGTAVGTVGTINATTNLLAFDFGSTPVTLNTGASTIEVRADIVKGSSRTISLSLQNSGDLIVTDSQLGVNIALSSFIASSGGTMTIPAGSVSTTVDTTFTSLTTVTGGSTSAAIGRFKLQAYGEDVKVSSLSVTPTLTSMSTSSVTTTLTTGTNTINNVALYWNGAQVGSLSSTNNSGTAIVYTLGSSLIVPAGSSGLLEVRADIQNTAGSNYTAGTIVSTLNVGTNYGQGQTSSTLVNVPTAAISTTGLTVATGALSIGQNTAYSGAQTVNPNTANVKIGSYVMQNTSSSESVRVSNLLVTLSTSGSVGNLSELRTSETSGSGSQPISPALGANNFSVNFTLAPGQSKTIDVMANLNSAATSSSTYTSTLLPTAVGASSNVTLTPGSATQGQTLTVQTGTLSAVPTLNPSPSSMSAQFVVGGASNLGVANYNFVATNGVGTISELKFLIGGGTTAATSTPVSQVCVGGVCANVNNNIAYLTGLNLIVPNSTSGLNVPVTATFNSIGSVGVGGNLSNTTAILNLTYIKSSVGGATPVSTRAGVEANIGVTSGTPSDVVSGVTSALTMTSTLTPLKVGMVISSIGATTTPASLLGGLGTIATVTSDTAATVAWATTTTIGASATMRFYTASSSALTMVGTKPTVSIVDSSDSLSNSLVKLAEITVQADAAGDMKLVALPISMTSTGVGVIASTTSAFTVKGTDGTSIDNSNGAFTMAAGGTATTTITFSSPYPINAGTSKVFKIYGTGQNVTGAVNTTSVSTKLGAASLLLWNDMVGGVNNITGSQIYNYPTDTSIITN